jgi:hypothetical protein
MVLVFERGFALEKAIGCPPVLCGVLSVVAEFNTLDDAIGCSPVLCGVINVVAEFMVRLLKQRLTAGCPSVLSVTFCDRQCRPSTLKILVEHASYFRVRASWMPPLTMNPATYR